MKKIVYISLLLISGTFIESSLPTDQTTNENMLLKYCIAIFTKYDKNTQTAILDKLTLTNKLKTYLNETIEKSIDPEVQQNVQEYQAEIGYSEYAPKLLKDHENNLRTLKTKQQRIPTLQKAILESNAAIDQEQTIIFAKAILLKLNISNVDVFKNQNYTDFTNASVDSYFKTTTINNLTYAQLLNFFTLFYAIQELTLNIPKHLAVYMPQLTKIHTFVKQHMYNNIVIQENTLYTPKTELNDCYVPVVPIDAIYLLRDFLDPKIPILDEFNISTDANFIDQCNIVYYKIQYLTSGIIGINNQLKQYFKTKKNTDESKGSLLIDEDSTIYYDKIHLPQNKYKMYKAYDSFLHLLFITKKVAYKKYKLEEHSSVTKICSTFYQLLDAEQHLLEKYKPEEYTKEVAAYKNILQNFITFFTRYKPTIFKAFNIQDINQPSTYKLNDGYKKTTPKATLDFLDFLCNNKLLINALCKGTSTNNNLFSFADFTSLYKIIELANKILPPSDNFTLPKITDFENLEPEKSKQTFFTQQEHTSNTKDLVSQNTTIEQLKDQITQLKKQNTDQMTAIQINNTKINKFQSENVNLHATVDRLEQTIQKLTKENNTLKERINNLTEENKKLLDKQQNSAFDTQEADNTQPNSPKPAPRQAAAPNQSARRSFDWSYVNPFAWYRWFKPS